MWNRKILYFLVVLSTFFCGCGGDEHPSPQTQSQAEATPTSSIPEEAAIAVEAAPTSSVLDEVAMAVAEIEKDFATIPCVVTNWAGAEAVAHQISGKIVKLPPALSEQYGRKMAQAILSVPIDDFSYYIRIRSLDTMFWMVHEIGWRDIKEEDVWELRIMVLTRYREAIDYARKEKKGWRNKTWRSKNYIGFLSDEINGYSEFWEKRLAYRVSKTITPNQYACEVETLPDKEYFAIRKRFEEFLGRPIRPYEDIVRAQRERERQLERKLFGPIVDDVKVEVDGL